VPDIAEGCVDDGRLADRGGGGDSRHFGSVQLALWVTLGWVFDFEIGVKVQWCAEI
jgi:hypothetical protein